MQSCSRASSLFHISWSSMNIIRAALHIKKIIYTFTYWYTTHCQVHTCTCTICPIQILPFKFICTCVSHYSKCSVSVAYPCNYMYNTACAYLTKLMYIHNYVHAQSKSHVCTWSSHTASTCIYNYVQCTDMRSRLSSHKASVNIHVTVVGTQTCRLAT